jgi:zinc transport system ATP-binding protein
MSGGLLLAEALTVGYAGPVVGPISFSVARGEVVGIWGANGSGKTTLLNAIGNGARIFGGRLDKAPGLSVAYQEQQPVRLREMPLNGRDFLRFAQAGREAVPERLRAWLDWRMDRLSGGQFQLLSVWALLATTTDLVLLDEPTNNLDPQGERILAEILVAEQGRRAALLVSHERDFLEKACSRVLVIA